MEMGAIVLCGGRSRRMGRSKAWLPFGPEFLLQRVVRRLAGAGPIVVVAGPGQEVPELPADVAIVRDPVADRGPLQGLAAGLDALPDHVALALATATDAPFIGRAWMGRLAELLGDADAAVPLVEGQPQPLAALYRRAAALSRAEGLLAAGELRMRALLGSLTTRVVPADLLRDVDPDLLALRNLNTPEDYRHALSLAGFEPVDIEGGA